MKALTAVLLVLGVLLPASAALAAPGVNLAWNACSAEGGVQSRTFACGSNAGTNIMVGSFILAADQNNFTGAEITIDIQAQSDSLPTWWQFKNSGSCRQIALTTSFNFASDPNTDCTDPWSGQGTGGIAAYHTYWSTPPVPGGGANTARLTMVAAVPSDIPMQLTAGTEYYCVKVNISNAKTVGSSACAGCSTPVCIVLSQIHAVQNDGNNETLTNPITSNTLAWQSGQTCDGAFANQNVTWGQIRSIMH